MKIINRYVIREHIGPLGFALTTLTSLLLLNYISKQFGNLVGKGLPWGVIAEFFFLSVPFTVAMTLPMAILVSTLYAFSRLASENEITALKASGVSMVRLLVPVLVGAGFMALVMLGFNDQVLPRANHRLRTLQGDIARTKPTFALREQVINEVSPGKLYLRANHLDEFSNRMREVTIYDLSDPLRRRTIYADSGNMALASNRRDLQLILFNGYMVEVPKQDPMQLQRVYYKVDHVRVPNVANTMERTDDDSFKSDREMSICEMQQEFGAHERSYALAKIDLREALVSATREATTGAPASASFVVPAPSSGQLPTANTVRTSQPGAPVVVRHAKGLAWAYCEMVARLAGVNWPSFAMRSAWAAESAVQDTTRRDTLPPVRDTARRDSVRAPQLPPGQQPQLPSTNQLPTPVVQPPPAAGPLPAPVPQQMSTSDSLAAAAARASLAQTPRPGDLAQTIPIASVIDAARGRMNESRNQMNGYEVEIQKKFALSVACIVFVLIGAPIALRFPRGGVGLTIGVSLIVFALYYVGLIAGESLANRGILTPFWAMWATNVILTVVALVMLARMGKEGSTSRGGDLSELIDATRRRFARLGRRLGVPLERREKVA